MIERLESLEPQSIELCFQKSQRLLKSSDFRGLFDAGIKVVDAHLVVVATPSKMKRARLGLVVSKKVGNAVHRNRVKRRLREIFRYGQNQVPVWDIVVIARSSACRIDFNDLTQSFERCLNRLRKRPELQG